MDSNLNWRNHPAFWAAIGVVVTIVLVVGVVLALRSTGDANAVSDNAPLIAAVIALGGVGTTQMVSIALEGRRVQEARKIEKQRTEDARNIEEQRAQEVALQQYFEQMGQLLRQGLRKRIYEEQQLRSLAEVMTYQVLGRLAPHRKWLLLQFLHFSGLIAREDPIIDLTLADLRGAILCEYVTIDKSEASKYLGNDADPSKYLSKDDLSAVLRSTDAGLDALLKILQGTLISVDLAGASLHQPIMGKAYLRSATLSDADLRDAYLEAADLIAANLSNANLRGAWLEEAVLIAANLNRANLYEAQLSDAVLVKADLARAELGQARLIETDLRKANLSNALRWTKKQLMAAKSLEDATMPDGSKHS
jgi:uncharacterized protein YjbI with pentapeptide repeats